MKRYRLTKSGVCDCMLPDDNGPWVKYEDAEQAHREGWEQCQKEAVKAAKHSHHPEGCFCDWCRIAHSASAAVAAMEYGGGR